MRRAATCLVSLLVATGVSAAEPRLNQIQVVGTHNSYSQPADPRVFQIMNPLLQPVVAELMKRMPEDIQRELADEHPHGLGGDLQHALEYRFPGIEAQLRLGVRSVELDLNVDHEGGRFSDPLPYRRLREQGVRDFEPLYEAALHEPGLKTLHMADVDFRSSCPSFRICLQQLRGWSDASPGHSPVFVLLEPKFSSMTSVLADATAVQAFDARAFAELDASIASVLGRERVITPDDVRGDSLTLEAAVRAGRWPLLSQARGKFVFLMIVPGMNLATFAPYLQGRPNLEGRMAFVQGRPGMPHAAFVLIDNALSRGEEIRSLVGKGYLVRSRADIDTGEARVNSVSRREAALSSGAQVVSTDYPFSPNIFGNSYVVRPFEGGWRLNPVNGDSSVVP